MSKSSTQITTKLTGEAVENGEMVITDYLEYLSGISELCKCANSYLNPGTNLVVKVHYNIEKGSIINLLLEKMQEIAECKNLDMKKALENYKKDLLEVYILVIDMEIK